MNRRRISLAAGLSFVALVCLSSAGGVQASERGQTRQGLDYLSGGIGLEERVELGGERRVFSLWVQTAAKGTGAFLSRADVKITDTAGEVALATTLDGPWLLVNLRRGRYVVEMTYNGHIQRQTTTIHTGDRSQMVFYYDAEP